MALLIEKYNYVPINRESVEGRRLYATPDGSKVPSVTTILDKTKPEESRIALANWRRAVGEQKAQQITTEAANRGTRMHKYLEDYVKGEVLRESVSNPYAQQSLDMAKIVIDKGFPKINEVWGVEVPLYFPGLYAGTTDCCGVHEGEEAILDYKQTNKPKKREYIDDYFIQLTAYAMAHNEVHGTNIRKGVILMCSKDYEYQEFILESKDFDYWQDRWLARVEQYYREN
jgi:CRISPR/Cas system-associated exonuclease Cas4 (RecB family)